MFGVEGEVFIVIVTKYKSSPARRHNQTPAWLEHGAPPAIVLLSRNRPV